jgi:hypothetical protein
MNLVAEGKFDLTPLELLEAAKTRPSRLINDVLIRGTPQVFDTYWKYCDFLSAVGGALRVHPASIFVRGSCKIGFSISPRIPRPPDTPKIWRPITNDSDIDLAIVDADFYYQVDDEIQRWEKDNKAHEFQGDEFDEYLARRRDRCFYCCRDYRLPDVVCVSFRDAIECINTKDFCDHRRPLTVFVYRDWWSLRRRYQYDLRQMCERVEGGRLPAPP